MTQNLLRLNELPADIAKKISQFKTDASAEIAKVDAEILKKQATLHKLQNSVCLDDAAALIEAAVLSSFRGKREGIQKTVDGAVLLSHHAPTTNVLLNSGGEVCVERREKRSMWLFPHDISALKILSLLWSDEDIKEFSKKSALAAGAKPLPEGRTVQEIEQLSLILNQEIEALYTARQEGLKALSGLVDIELVPFISKVAPSAPIEPSPKPSISRRDKDGNMVVTRN